MMPKPGELLMLYFPIGNRPSYHPGIVVSVFEEEELFYAVMLSTKAYNLNYAFEISANMVNQSNGKYPSFAKCHLLNPFTGRDIDRRVGRLKEPHLKQLIQKVINTLFHEQH